EAAAPDAGTAQGLHGQWMDLGGRPWTGAVGARNIAARRQQIGFGHDAAHCVVRAQKQDVLRSHVGLPGHVHCLETLRETRRDWPGGIALSAYAWSLSRPFLQDCDSRRSILWRHACRGRWAD